MSVIDAFRNSTGIKKSIGGMFHLAIWQYSVTLLQLILVPILFRRVGAGAMGLYFYTLALTAYVQLFIDFGFNYTATRRVIDCQNLSVELSALYSIIQQSKLFLAGIAVICSVPLLLIDPKLELNSALYWCHLGSAISASLFPTWLFQGIGQMRVMSLLNISSRLLSFALILAVVHTADSLYWIPLINGVAGLSINFGAHGYLHRIHDIRGHRVSLTKTYAALRNSYRTFLSVLSTNLYANINVVLLSSFASVEVTGVYGTIERLISGLRSLYLPVTRAIYPSFVEKFNHNPAKALHQLHQFAWIGGGTLMVLSIGISSKADAAMYLILGRSDEWGEWLLTLLAFIPPLTFVGSLYAVIGLMSLRRDTHQLKLFSLAGLLYFGSAWILLEKGGYRYLPVLTLLTEISISVIAFWLVSRKGEHQTVALSPIQ